jgi:hypothetical protein
MSCGKTVVDYVLGICYYIPCDYAEMSMDYFEKLQLLGIAG